MVFGRVSKKQPARQWIVKAAGKAACIAKCNVLKKRQSCFL
ncbi:hypothetical protein HMPREF9098_0396 [Kingella denitrificans ATCC 33394]|uniref:Uncharacterized protein n=1 Tax=Kingella denitrificans ATCC 33394 TaxID=888741 RepID=F0EX16_9NEIS|nr:hypothetical protein HMPREF9098_0396 [Kingella denitrificans ATCC 33394]